VFTVLPNHEITREDFLFFILQSVIRANTVNMNASLTFAVKQLSAALSVLTVWGTEFFKYLLVW
jgi:hypothetical protein